MSSNELESLYKAIFSRKSVRKYSQTPLNPEALDEVLRTANATAQLDSGLPAAFQILTANQVKGIVSAKAAHFLAVYAQPGLESLTNAGFRLQQMDLWFSAQGLGSCWLGMPNSIAEVATHDGLPFVILLAFGTPAEQARRGSVTEFKRNALSEITSLAGADKLIEPMRLAPSASNRQPWKVSGDNSILRLNIKKDGVIGKMMFKEMRFSDAGIALCHLWLAANHANTFAGFVKEPTSADTPKGYEYIYSIRLAV